MEDTRHSLLYLRTEVLSSAINLSLIVATHRAYLTAIAAATLINLNPVLDYERDKMVVVSVVFMWDV